MKKFMVFLLSAVMAAAVVGCGKGKEEGKEQEAAYESALDVLDTVAAAYDEDEMFPMAGGDSEHASMEGPAAFDVSKTEELNTTLGLPESEVSHIDDAASLVHMMNANTFTGAAYHLTKDVDVKDFAKAVEDNVMSRQWICGMPDTFIVIQADKEYVITAFGADEIIQTFKTNAAEALKDSEVILETAVSEP